MPSLAPFAQLFGSYWIERPQRRKPIFLLANIVHRSLWLVIAAKVFVVALVGLAVLIFVSWIVDRFLRP